MPGRAYWVLARNGLQINVHGVPVTTNQSVLVKLAYSQFNSNGWNMIGCPNGANYDWQKIQVLKFAGQTIINESGNLITEEQAPLIMNLLADNDFINLGLWRWRNGTYEALMSSAGDIQTSTGQVFLNAYEGYWVEAKQANIYLRFSRDARITRKKSAQNRVLNITEQDETIKTRSAQFNDMSWPPDPMAGLIEESS